MLGDALKNDVNSRLRHAQRWVTLTEHGQSSTGCESWAACCTKPIRLMLLTSRGQTSTGPGICEPAHNLPELARFRRAVEAVLAGALHLVVKQATAVLRPLSGLRWTVRTRWPSRAHDEAQSRVGSHLQYVGRVLLALDADCYDITIFICR